jgi:hypothetical protein
VGFPEGFIPTHPLWYHFFTRQAVQRHRPFQSGLPRTALSFRDPMSTHCAKRPGMPAFSS